MPRKGAQPVHNLPAAFLGFARGQTLDELSQTMAIPLSTLQEYAQKQNWLALAAKLSVAPEPQGILKAQLAVIEANRKKNFQIASDLRDDLIDVVRNLRSTGGHAMIEKQWHYRGAVTRAEVPMSISDRATLASYAKTIADLTYRSLGDRDAAEGGGHEGPANAQSAPTITIILPGVISRPRNEQSANDLQGNMTLDLSSDKVTVTEELRQLPSEVATPEQVS